MLGNDGSDGYVGKSDRRQEVALFSRTLHMESLKNSVCHSKYGNRSPTKYSYTLFE